MMSRPAPAGASAAKKMVGASSMSLLLLALMCSQAMVAAFVATPAFNRGVTRARDAMEGQSKTTAGLGKNGLPVRGQRAIGSRTKLAMGFSLFSFGQKAKDKTNTASQLSAELFSMLTDERVKPTDATVVAKIEELEAVPGLTFNKDYLYDGPWRVVWKTNTAWQRYFDPLNNVADNRAYQWYKEDGSVTNIAQAFGDKLYVTVDGQGTPASQSKNLPYEVNVEVSRGWLHALGGKVPLDFIKGKGTTFVVYNDAKLRIFRSDSGGLVVQTKADEVVPT